MTYRKQASASRVVAAGIVVCLALLVSGVIMAAQVDETVALSAEHLDKLRKIAMSADLTATPLTAGNAKILGLTDAIQAKQLMGELPDGRFMLAFSVAADTDDILFAQRTPDLNYIFLTNSSLVLRAAMVVDPTGGRLITNDQAAADYRKSLKTWDELAAALR